MDGPAFAVVFGVIPTFFSLAISILLYRLVYRKKKRNRANLYSWLITMGIAIVTEIILFAVFKEDLGLQVVSSYFYVPLIGLGIPSVWALIRLITIKATPNKERNVIQKTQEPKLD
jgi:branched-subunit amino acid ABC-type transport system permease component